MKNATKKWLEYAQADIEVAGALFLDGKKLGSAYQACVFHCHQAVEKILKGFLAEQGTAAPKTHDLVRLATLTGLPFSKKRQDFIQTLNPHYQPPRYPDLPFGPRFQFTYNLAQTKKILDKSQELFLWLKKRLTQDE